MKSQLVAAAALVACGGSPVRPDEVPTPKAGVVYFEVQATNDKGTFSLLPGTPLQSHDRLAVLGESTQPTFVYVGHRQQTRPMQLIFPAAGQPPLQLLPGQPQRIPEAGQWFQLDAQPGEETLYFLASNKQIDSVDAQKIITDRVEANEVRTREPPPVMTERNRGARLEAALAADGLALVTFPISHH